MQRFFAGIVIIVVLVLVAMTRQWPDLLLYLFYLRVPVLVGLAVIAVPVVGIKVAPGMLRNLFSYDTWLDVAVVTAFSILSSIAVGLSALTIVTGAPLRYGAPSWHESALFVWLLGAALVVISLSTVVTCWRESRDLERTVKLWSVVGGSVVALAASALGYWLVVLSGFEQGLLGILGWFGSILGDGSMVGYFTTDGSLLTGHLAASAFLVVVVLLYVLSYHLFKPTTRLFSWRPPALFFLFQIMIFLCIFFSGASFFFDRYRFPALLAALALSAAIFVISGTDHYFRIHKAPESFTVPDPQDEITLLRDALNERLSRQPENDRTLVVVCASGGGVQAAAWTARVLTNLQLLYGGDFVQAIGLISSASGGSVGTLHYLDHFDVEAGCPPVLELDTIFERTTRNSLSATAWGMSGPDFLKAAFLPWAVPRKRDRGWAIEEQWRNTLEHDGATLADWGKHVKGGQMPCPVFNATVVETGDRLLLAPVAMRHALETNETEDFYSLYGTKDVDVVTAARLSSTFPYVTPVCRPDPRLEPDSSHHVADGGYFDNFGTSTAVEWIDKVVLNAPGQLGIKRIQVLEINAFPEPAPQKKESESGWLHSFAGPLIALLKVRTSTQTARNANELDLLRRVCWGKVNLDRLSFRFSLGQETGDSKVGTAAFRGRKGDYQPPLSWKLTRAEKEAIDAGWDQLEEEGSTLTTLDRVWL